MVTMIERVARAIFQAEYSGGEADEFRWERSSDVYREQARAALMALRDPTNPMLDAGRGETDWEPLARAVWDSMIDAALEEEPTIGS